MNSIGSLTLAVTSGMRHNGRTYRNILVCSISLHCLSGNCDAGIGGVQHFAHTELEVLRVHPYLRSTMFAPFARLSLFEIGFCLHAFRSTSLGFLSLQLAESQTCLAEFQNF